MGMFFKDSPVAIVKCEKCCKRNIQILIFLPQTSCGIILHCPGNSMQNMKKKIGKKHKSVLIAKIGFCSRTDGMPGVDDLGESGCPRWSYGDGVLNTGMYLLHKIYTVSIYHMYCIVYRWSQVAIWGWSQIQDMNLLHKKYTESNYHMYCIEVVTLGW